MPTNTYVALDKVTVSGTSTTSISFTSIPATYTDLEIVYNGNTNANTSPTISFNGDTASNYSYTRLFGSGSTASSDRTANSTLVFGVGASLNPNVTKISVMNYSNATTYKTALFRWNDSAAYVAALVGLWRSTAAINRVDITIPASYFVAGSTFSLYGIASQEAAAKATGGMVTSDANYYYHTFTASGTFTPKQTLSCDVLVVAGGGGGSSRLAGGGGAGGLLGFTSQSVSSATNVTIGSGGAGGSGGNTSSSLGVVGNDSQFGALTLVKGGGRGGSYQYGNGGNGGSGGGGAGLTNTTAGTATSGQGFDGGVGVGGTYCGGGGGGSAAVGTAGNTSTGVGGNGGVGLSTYSSWGSATSTGQNSGGTYYFAGGGGGAGHANGSTHGTGGLGGGGAGAGTAATSGTTNTGGGGGACRNEFDGASTGGAGGSGIVIVRYAK